ncbi:MAG: 1-phosphofructokinase family hexose kinase [Actinomycetaceae bacterium]|nr:1-phosphofructokinase family hexose kinase [Actinomycetaceae bacterium]
MIITLTPNPSLDRTVTLGGELVRGGVNRLSAVTVEPGGKGLNVARVLVGAGLSVSAILPAASRDPLLNAVETVATNALKVHVVPVAGTARINTAVTEPDGTTTKLNEPGATLDHSEVAALELALIDRISQASDKDDHHWVILSGSLPPGVPNEFYAGLVARLRQVAPQVRIAVDTSDAPLAAITQAFPSAAPDLIKPNGEELGQLAGLPRERAMALEEGARRGEFTPIVEAGAHLVDQGVGAVLATLGPAGAVLITADGAWHASAPDVPVLSTVGAGDSSIAGYILADVNGADEAARLRSAMAYGSAAASLPGTQLPTTADLPQAQAIITTLEGKTHV